MDADNAGLPWNLGFGTPLPAGTTEEACVNSIGRRGRSPRGAHKQRIVVFKWAGFFDALAVAVYY
jgi:hypothetical protein